MEPDPLQLRKIKDDFTNLIRREFPGGLTPGSIIDRKKLARLFQDHLPFSSHADYEDEASITALCKEFCIPVGKKFYAVSPAARCNLAKILEELHSSLRNTIYFICLYNKYAQGLQGIDINSPQILSACINKFFSVSVNEEYFCFHPLETPEMEVLRIFGESIIVTPESIGERLPFIPVDIVRKILADSGRFIAQKNDTLISKAALEFDEEEFEKALAETRAQINETGYMPLKLLKFPCTQELNPGIPRETILTAFAEKLSDKELERHAQFIRCKNAPSLPSIITEFCRNADSFSYDELKEKFGIDGVSIRNWIGLAQKSAIQVDKEHFVNRDKIEFDVQKIDATLLDLTGGKPFTILSFTEFALLPPVHGYPWNSHLLQSFCIHASEIFSLSQPACNNSCIGIIFRKDSAKNSDYSSLVVKIALEDGISPDFISMKRYIEKKGIFANKRDYTINNLIVAMRNIQ